MTAIENTLAGLPIVPALVDLILKNYDGDRHFATAAQWSEIMNCIPGIATGRGGTRYGKGEWWIAFAGDKLPGYAKLASLTRKGWIDLAVSSLDAHLSAMDSKLDSFTR